MLLKKTIKSDRIVAEYKSTNIKHSEYIPLSRKLIVEFNSGRQYEYDNVPLSIYLDFEVATSQGSYIKKLLKYNPKRIN